MNKQEEERHIFWDNQPVRIYSEYTDINNQLCHVNPIGSRQVSPLVRVGEGNNSIDNSIKDDKLIKAIKEWKPNKESKLPSKFGWKILDLNNKNDKNELIKFLCKNYVGIDGLYSIKMTDEYINYCLNSNNKSINIALILNENQKIYGFISGVLNKFHIYGKDIDVALVSFLSVHKKLRGKYMAAVLIKKLINDITSLNVWQAIYSVSKDLKIHIPLATIKIYHRPLNYKQLANLGFISSKYENYKDRILKHHKIKYKLINLSELSDKEIDKVEEFYNNNMKKNCDAFILYKRNTKNSIMKEFVVYNNKHKIIGYISFFTSKYNFSNKIIEVANLYKYMCTNEIEIYRLIRELLYYCKNNGYSLFNSNNSFRSEEFLELNNFITGTGFYNFYIFNWDCLKINLKRLSFESL